jgi:hypothetical protein
MQTADILFLDQKYGLAGPLFGSSRRFRGPIKSSLFLYLRRLLLLVAVLIQNLSLICPCRGWIQVQSSIQGKCGFVESPGPYPLDRTADFLP